MTYYPIDGMYPGETVVLLVTATNPESEKWKPHTRVTVTRNPTSWSFESSYGSTESDKGHQGLNAHMKTLTGAPWSVSSYTEKDLIRRAYLSERHRGYRATEALKRARSNPKPFHLPSIGGSDGQPFKAYGEDAMRWFENPSSKGLRLAHECDTGWYLDDHCSETVSGVVYQLPARKGLPRYMYGYADPYNDGPACLSLDIVTGERTDSSWDPDPVLRDVACYADGVAERMAEQEREYQEAHSAGYRARSLAQDMREAARAYVQAVRSLREGADCSVLGPMRRAVVEARARFHEALDPGYHDISVWREGYADF